MRQVNNRLTLRGIRVDSKGSTEAKWGEGVCGASFSPPSLLTTSISFVVNPLLLFFYEPLSPLSLGAVQDASSMPYSSLSSFFLPFFLFCLFTHT